MCQDKKWGETNARGDPVGDGCYICMAVISEGWPKLTWPEALERYNSGNASDKLFRVGVGLTSKHFEQLHADDNDDSPAFKPASSVDTTARTATQVFMDAGVLTEAELLRECKNVTVASLKGVKLQPVTLEDGTETKGIIVTLKGLDLATILSMRKVRLYHDVSLSHREEILQPCMQIRQEQGMDIFEMASKQALKLGFCLRLCLCIVFCCLFNFTFWLVAISAIARSSRPEGLKNASRSRLPSLPELQAQAEAVIADREAAEKAALAAASSPRAEDDESLEGSGSEEGASAVKGRSAPALTFGSLAKQQTKANKKKIVANSRRKGARSPSPAAGSTGSRGSGSVINCAPVEELRRTDPEMAIVATRCQNSQGKNVECLLSLDIGRILLGEKLGRGVDSAGGWAI